MNTCVLPFRRRNGFEWTIRSRSRWNGVRTGDSSSGCSRPRVSYDLTASGESDASSSSRIRAANVSAMVSGIDSSLIRMSARLVTRPHEVIRNAHPIEGRRVMAVSGTLQRDELRQRVRGEVVAEGDAGYDEARRVWNGVIDRRPALVVGCTGNADVIASIAFAREHGLPVSVRGGGHNVAGTAGAEGALVPHLRALRNGSVDGQR